MDVIETLALLTILLFIALVSWLSIDLWLSNDTTKRYVGLVLMLCMCCIASLGVVAIALNDNRIVSSSEINPPR